MEKSLWLVHTNIDLSWFWIKFLFTHIARAKFWKQKLNLELAFVKIEIVIKSLRQLVIWIGIGLSALSGFLPKKSHLHCNIYVNISLC
jgi:hypothetical protein